jgi:hypothetical protein
MLIQDLRQDEMFWGLEKKILREDFRDDLDAAAKECLTEGSIRS